MSTSGGYHEYIGRIWVHWGDIMRGDIMSTSGGYHEYIGGISWVHRGDIMSTSGGISWVHRGMFSTSGDVQYIGVFNRNWKDFIKLLPHMYHDIPPMYWTSPDVLMISPRCTHGIPPMYWTSPDVLMVSPHVHHDIPPMYWTSPDVLMISPRCTHGIPRCTEHPPMYWTSPDVLNTHYTGWLSHLQSPPERMQSQCNYGSILWKWHLHGTILWTKLAQDRPVGKKQCLIRAICYFQIINYQTGGSNCEMFEITWQMFILKAVLHWKKRKLISRIKGVLAKIRCRNMFSSVFCRKRTTRDN